MHRHQRIISINMRWICTTSDALIPLRVNLDKSHVVCYWFSLIDTTDEDKEKQISQMTLQLWRKWDVKHIKRASSRYQDNVPDVLYLQCAWYCVYQHVQTLSWHQSWLFSSEKMETQKRAGQCWWPSTALSAAAGAAPRASVDNPVQSELKPTAKTSH